MHVLHVKMQLVCCHRSMRRHGETQERREPFPLQTSFPRRVIQPTHPDEQMLFVFKRAQVDTAAVMSCANHHVVNILGPKWTAINSNGDHSHDEELRCVAKINHLECTTSNIPL